jgi:hypothetical protein
MYLRSRSSVLPIFAIAFLVAGIADAQFDQYTAPGGPEQRPESREARLKREIEFARYRLGPFRISPELGIKDVAYVRNLFDSTGSGASDFTATVGGGARAYLRSGPKVTWVAHLRPDYVSWRRRSEARRLNMTYGLEGLGFFNHLFVGVLAGRSEQQRIINPEVLQPVSARADEVQATAELRISGALSMFATGTVSHQTGLVDTLPDPLTRRLSLLDRKDRVVRAGLRWRQRSGWTVGVGAERSQVDFDRAALDSSNSGTAPVLELRFDRRRFFFQSDLAARSLRASEGSRFVTFDGVTGSASVSFQLRPGLEIWTYGSRNLVYSLSPSYPYLDDRRNGLSLSVGLGRRITTHLYAETGRERYVAFSPTTLRREDDLTSFGGSVSFRANELLTFAVQATRTRLDSNAAGAGRAYTSGGFSIALGAL